MDSLSIYGDVCNWGQKLWGGNPGLRARPADEWSFGEYIAKVLTNPHDVQHIALTVYGLPGVGKSTTGISIGMKAADALAKINGGDDVPANHFDLGRDIWVGDREDEFISVLSKAYQRILIRDESGLTEDARDSMKTDNKRRAKAAMIARDRRCCIIRCVQTKDIVDKRIKAMATHEVQIVEDHHDDGYNVCKIKKLRLIDGDKDPFRMYISPNGIDRIVRHIVYAPPIEVYKRYQVWRQGEVTDWMQEPQERHAKSSSSREAVDERCGRAWLYYLDEGHPFETLGRVATKHGLDVKSLQRWMGNPSRGLEVKGGTPIVFASARNIDPDAERKMQEGED
jgi:hypothetical protein